MTDHDLDLIKEKEYLKKFSIKDYLKNDHECFCISDSDLIKILNSVSKENEWEFRQIEYSTRTQFSPIGYIETKENTYKIKGTIEGLTFYDENERKITDKEKAIEVIKKFRKPIRDHVNNLEKEWWAEKW